MSYTIKHIRLNEGAPFKALKQNIPDKDENQFNNITKLNKDIFLRSIKTVLRVFLFNMSYINNRSLYTDEKFKICTTIYDEDDIQMISTLSLGFYNQESIYNNINDIDIDNVTIDIFGKTANIVIPTLLLRFTKFFIMAKGSYSTKEFYVDALNDMLHGIYSKSLCGCIFKNTNISDWESELDNAVKITSSLSYNIKYSLISKKIDYENVTLSLFGLTSTKEIEDNFLSMFTNLNVFKEHKLGIVRSFNSFQDSRDMSEIYDLTKLFDLSNVYECEYYFYDDRTRLGLGYMDEWYRRLISEYDNFLHKGGIMLSNFSKIMQTSENFRIYIAEPKRHSILNSLLDDSNVVRTLQQTSNTTRFDRFIYMFDNFKRKLSSFTDQKRIQNKVVKLQQSTKAMNNINNDEYNKYIIEIDSDDNTGFSVLATAVGS